MCAPFTAMEFLKTLVRALGTYESPLSFDRVVLVDMFEMGVNTCLQKVFIHFLAADSSRNSSENDSASVVNRCTAAPPVVFDLCRTLISTALDQYKG